MRRHQGERRNKREQKRQRIGRQVRARQQAERIKDVERRTGFQRLPEIIFEGIHTRNIRRFRRRHGKPDPEDRHQDQDRQGGKNEGAPPPVGHATFEQPRARKGSADGVEIERGKDYPPSSGVNP